MKRIEVPLVSLVVLLLWFFASGIALVLLSNYVAHGFKNEAKIRQEVIDEIKEGLDTHEAFTLDGQKWFAIKINAEVKE